MAAQGEPHNKLTLELILGSFEYLKCLIGEHEFTDLERQLEVCILELQTSKRSGLFAEIEGFKLCFRGGAEDGIFMSVPPFNSDFNKAVYKLFKKVCFRE